MFASAYLGLEGCGNTIGVTFYGKSAGFEKVAYGIVCEFFFITELWV
jgi:hypothetical protein